MKAIVEHAAAAPVAMRSLERRPAAGGADNAARRSVTPEKLARLLRGDLDNIVAKALKKKPGRALRNGQCLRRATCGATSHHEPVSARADVFWYRAAKFTRRNRVSVSAGALAIAAICAGLAGALGRLTTARQQRDRALALLDRSNAVIDFFEFMLTDAGPPDKPQTINSMLARSESLLTERARRQPGAAGRHPAGAGVVPGHRRRRGAGRTQAAPHPGAAARRRRRRHPRRGQLPARLRGLDARRRRGRRARNRSHASRPDAAGVRCGQLPPADGVHRPEQGRWRRRRSAAPRPGSTC